MSRKQCPNLAEQYRRKSIRRVQSDFLDQLRIAKKRETAVLAGGINRDQPH
jgi:hypothetical protein